jgi:GxxExxY protein
MQHRQRWAIIKKYREMSSTKTIIKAETEKKTIKLSTAEKEQKKIEAAAKKLLKEQKKLQKDAEKAFKDAEKAFKDANPKPRGRPRKVALSVEPLMPYMAQYEKRDFIRGLAEEVYKELGAGHVEGIYQEAMLLQLRLNNLQYEREMVLPVKFKGQQIGSVRADIILAQECVLEFKISGKMEDALQQTRQYMKITGIKYGYAVMFPKTDGAEIRMVDARLPDALDM